MDSLKTANILMIVLLALTIFKIVWDIKFAHDVADETEKKAEGKTDGDDKEKTNGFFGTRSFARKLTK